MPVTTGACTRSKAESLEPTRDEQASARAAGPSFKADIMPVLERHCADAKGCHGSEPTESIALDLRAPSAFRELVNVPAKGRPGSWRIRPRDPAKSFMLDKLAGKLRADEGKAMPLDPDTGVPIVPSPVPPSFTESVLKPWIEAGAQDN
jgi:hypothetical protein